MIVLNSRWIGADGGVGYGGKGSVDEPYPFLDKALKLSFRWGPENLHFI